MKRFIFLLFTCIAIFADEQDNPTFKRTFFTTVPSFRPTTPEIVACSRDRLIMCWDDKQSFQAIIMGGASQGTTKLARYFLPICSDTSFVAGELGSSAVVNSTDNVIATYFGVLTAPLLPGGSTADFSSYTFQSQVSFAPKQRFWGIAFDYHRHLSKTQDHGWWIEFIIPIKWVKNNLNLKEKIITQGGPNGDDPEVPNGFVGNMTEAFKQPLFKFGKIDGAQSAVGVADIYAMLGYTYFQNENRFFNTYWGAVLPTSNKPKGEFMFEPIFGNNGHAGILSAASIGARIWHDCTSAIYWELDTAGTLLFENKQTRSFDLKDKTWGRYMWVYLNNTATATAPGINYFTKTLKVSPGTLRDLNIGFVFERPCVKGEFGYHFFSRSAEKIKLSSPWEETIAIATIVNDSNEIISSDSDKISRSRSTISDYLGVLNDNNAAGDAVYKVVTAGDIDLSSASHPGTIMHTFYVAGSFNWVCRWPQFVSAGMAYDFGSDNTTMDRFNFWAKYAIEF